MLGTETVSPATLELLMELMRDKELSAFFLVGGTALSLMIGHRISIDIALFSQQPFDENKLSAHVETAMGFKLSFQDRNTIKVR